jgi:NADH:ubiquinone oxidoreductase subunit 2 (subunit N)
MATAFMGYVLPWGQMSFWGATVITNLFSAIPYIGDSIVQLLWGGFSVDNPTLNRFFSLHYLVPFLIAGLALLHLILLHQPGSNNPLGIDAIYDRIPFYPYFYVKDLFALFVFVLFFSFFVIYAPNYLGHPDNYIEANPLVTPAHIVPEWYFLPFYAVLRSIPDKLGGVILMGAAIVILALLPVVDTSTLRSTFFKPFNIWLFWFFFADSISLGWIGQEIVETPFIEMGIFVTFWYFFHFIVLLPLGGFLENAVINYEIRQASFLFFNASLMASSQDSSVKNTVESQQFLAIMEKESFEEAFNFNDFTLNIFTYFQFIEAFQVAFIAVFLLMLSLFFPKQGVLTRFTNKLASVYLLFIIWAGSFGIIFNGVNLTLETLDSLGIVINSESSFDLTTPFLGQQSVSEWLSLAHTDYSWLPLYTILSDSLFAKLFFIYALLIICIFFYGISDRYFVANSYEIEFPVMIFFIHIGSLFLFTVQNLIEFVIAIEIVTLATYTLTAFAKKNRFSTDAGVQYFIIGSVPSGFLVLGVALLYKSWGTLGFGDLDVLLTDTPALINHFELFNFFIQNNLSAPDSVTEVLSNSEAVMLDFVNFSFIEFDAIYNASTPYSFGTLLAIFLIFFNFLFKITAAPFHFWAPTVYGKSPVASVAFLSIFSKAMIFFAITKFYLTFLHSYAFIILPFLMFVALISVLFGMIGAFSEKGIKRFFVYSSMGHVGFMLVGISLATREGLAATFHYLPVYIITSFIMWFILLHLGEETNHLVDFSRLKNSNRMLALIFSLIIFSMSGIPPLGGFFVKLDILYALMESSRFGVNFIFLFFTVASFFYYLRVVKIIFFDKSTDYSEKTLASEERLQAISVLFVILLFYMFLVEKPLLEIQVQALNSLF